MSVKPLHILFLPSYYPDVSRPVTGLFFRDQALAVCRHREVGKVGLVSVEVRSLRSLSINSLKASHFQLAHENDDGIVTLRQRGWNFGIKGASGPRGICAGHLWSLLSFRLVQNYIRREGRPDIIHAHNAFWAGDAAYKISRACRIPYVITEHSTAFPLRMISPLAFGSLRKCYDAAKAVIAVSGEMRKAMKAYWNEERIGVVPNLVDTDFFNLPPYCRSTVPYRFVTVAHLIERKGIDLLIQAFADTFRGNTDVLLEIGGDGPERPALEELVRRLGISSQVTFLGRISRSSVRDALWRANAFVLPSFQETFGVVVIEALSTGIPVIATRCGGPEDILTGETGIITRTGSIPELSTALKNVFDAPDRYVPGVIRNAMVTKYASSAVASQLVEIYRSALD